MLNVTAGKLEQQQQVNNNNIREKRIKDEPSIRL